MKVINKPLITGAVFLVILDLVSHSQGQSLIKWEDYLRNVGRKLIALLEEREITGSGMPMQDFEGVINETMSDVTARGTAKFNSGFIAKIDESGTLSTSFRAQVLSTHSNVNSILTLDGVQVVYDVDYEYEDFKERGTFLIWFKQLQFQMIITRNHTSKEIVPTIAHYSSGSQNDYVIKVHPNNGYTQLTAKAAKSSTVYRQPLTDSFKNWSESWKNEIETAAMAYKFPEICYYCP